MNEESNNRLSRTSEKLLVQSITSVASSSQDIAVEDGQTTSRSTEDDINSQCASASVNKDSVSSDREPLFIIVGSNCESNPSSKEMLINKKNVMTENSSKIKRKRNVIPAIDTPGTSRDQTYFILPLDQEEMEMVDINLQSENEIDIGKDNNETEQESIVIAYLRNKDVLSDTDGLSTTRKKSSILENVPKMETIPEDKQFSSFMELSETSLDAFIPSCPGSPRSLTEPGPSEATVIEEDPTFRRTVDFLHQDKEFLMAAEIGNGKLLEMYLRSGTDIQQMDHLGRNALHWAVCSNNLRNIQILLDAGVNPNIKDSLGMTPLSLCLMRRPSLTIAKLLFDHNAKLMPRSDPMDTGLFIQFVMMCTPTSEELGILNLLIEKGSVVNDSQAPGGRQVLHFAAMSNNVTLIRILVSLGADLYMKNHRNERPIDVAETFRCREAYSLLCDLEENKMSLSSCNHI